MRGAIVLIMAVLGVVLVLTGVAALWGSALAGPRTDGTEIGAASRMERGLHMVGRLPAPAILIKWGVVLLALAAVAAGAISFSVTASAGTS
jgi:hypothetical protein